MTKRYKHEKERQRERETENEFFFNTENELSPNDLFNWNNKPKMIVKNLSQIVLGLDIYTYID